MDIVQKCPLCLARSYLLKPFIGEMESHILQGIFVILKYYSCLFGNEVVKTKHFYQNVLSDIYFTVLKFCQRFPRLASGLVGSLEELRTQESCYSCAYSVL